MFIHVWCGDSEEEEEEEDKEEEEEWGGGQHRCLTGDILLQPPRRCG